MCYSSNQIVRYSNGVKVCITAYEYMQEPPFSTFFLRSRFFSVTLRLESNNTIYE